MEYSSREVKPAALLLQDLLRAHATFLLHHDSSLSALFVRIKRTKFANVLGRYWDLFLSTWNVLLHGNPICNIFDGIKIAASGELGVGVGEEDRGSGEREVLEGLVGRVEGLVDLVVSKFGSYDPEAVTSSQAEHWLGTGNEPGAEDGAIFLGVGAVSKNSLRNITHWVEDLYSWGENAYGVIDSPTSTRQAKRVKRAKPSSQSKPAASLPGGVPVPVPAAGDDQGQNEPQGPDNSTTKNRTPATQTPVPVDDTEAGGIDKYMDYLKLGYGKYWSLGSGGSSDESKSTSQPSQSVKESKAPADRRPSMVDDTAGHFLIGLTGEVEEDEYEDLEESRFHDSLDESEYNSRTMLRTVTVELESVGLNRRDSQKVQALGSQETEVAEHDGDHGEIPETITASFQSQDSNKTKKLRVVVYVNKPFIFTFLFQLRTDSLAWDGLYRSLHHQLSPLRKPLGNSTAYRPERPDQGATAAQIYDLIWDAKALTLHSTIPNIPDPGTIQNGEPTAWPRVEALNTHMQILNVYIATRADVLELERTCKTSRGWWVVWSRIIEREQGASTSSHEQDEQQSPGLEDEEDDSNEEETTKSTHQDHTISKEIFLLRKASDHGGSHVRAVSLGGGWADGASRLAQGIGVDTRRYIEGLLSLNR